jgi:hypothetical protein
VDEDERFAAVDDGFEASGDAADLGVASDERGGVAEARARPGLVFEAQELEHFDRLTLAFQAHGSEPAPGGGVLGGARGLLAGPDGADRRDRADARGGVHGVADDRVLEVGLHPGHDEPGPQPDAQPDRQASAGLGLEQAPDALLHGLCSADGPLRVVLVRERGAEDGHDAVAGELVDVPAELVHRGHALGEEPVGHGRDPLGVEAFGPGGEVGEVAEEHRDIAPLRLGSGRFG